MLKEPGFYSPGSLAPLALPSFRELLIGKPRRVAQGDKLGVLYVLAHGKEGELRQRPARSNTDLWHV